MENDQIDPVGQLPSARELVKMRKRPEITKFTRYWVEWPLGSIVGIMVLAIAIAALSNIVPSAKSCLVSIAWNLLVIGYGLIPVWAVAMLFPAYRLIKNGSSLLYAEVDNPSGDWDKFSRDLTAYPIEQISLLRRNIAQYARITENQAKFMGLMIAIFGISLTLLAKSFSWQNIPVAAYSLPGLIIGGGIGCILRYGFLQSLMALDRDLAEAEIMIGQKILT